MAPPPTKRRVRVLHPQLVVGGVAKATKSVPEAKSVSDLAISDRTAPLDTKPTVPVVGQKRRKAEEVLPRVAQPTVSAKAKEQGTKAKAGLARVETQATPAAPPCPPELLPSSGKTGEKRMAPPSGPPTQDTTPLSLPQALSEAAESTVVLRLGRESLLGKDLTRLEDDVFLNDSIINFFVQFIARFIAPSSKGMHIFNTQFFTQLMGRGVTSGEDGWLNVKTWTKRVPDILGHQFLLVPINETTSETCHWWLAAVALPEASPANGAASPANGATTQRPGRIFLLDSLACEPEREEFRSSVIRFLRGYLAREEEERHKSLREQAATASCAPRPLRRLPFEVVDSPAQENGVDCGLFVLELCAELLTRGSSRGMIELALKGDDGPRSWFGQERISRRRAVLREVARTLVAEAERQDCEDVDQLLGEPTASDGLLQRVRDLWCSALPQ